MAAGRIPQSFIDELLARVDIIEVIDAHLPLKKVGRSYQALCPFHREKTPSFNVNPDKQFYHCFGCGASGSAIRFLMEHARLGFVEAVTQLADRVGLEIPTATGPVRRHGHAELYAVLDQATQWFVAQLRQHPAAGPAVAYLKQRGLSDRIAAAYRIGYAPPGWDHLLCGLGTDPDRVDALVRGGMLARKDGGACYDRFRDRVMFPIADPRGRVIGFGGRVIGEGSPKYLNCPETPIFHKGGEVYGLPQALQGHDKPKRLFVVEGYMDVLALAQHGITNAVATLGTALTREHLGRLFRVVPDLVFCFDGDDAGLRAAWRALETALAYLSEGRSVGFLILPNGEDPDSLVRAEGPGLFERAEAVTPLSTFLFERLSAGTNPRTVEGRARLLEMAVPLLATVPTVLCAISLRSTCRTGHAWMRPAGWHQAAVHAPLRAGTSRNARCPRWSVRPSRPCCMSPAWRSPCRRTASRIWPACPARGSISWWRSWAWCTRTPASVARPSWNGTTTASREPI